MNSFLKKIVLFSSLCIALSLVMIGVYVFKYKISTNDIPAPPLSDSYSLNEKIEFLRATKKDAQVLAIGSSIALNNLHSETVFERMHQNESDFLNAASWGMNMGDNYSLLKIINEVYHPEVLIIASSMSEFELPAKKADYKRMQKYLTAGDLESSLYHLTCFNLRYYMDNTKYKKFVRSVKNQYEYLVFDPHGGVNIDDTDFKIDQRRWKADFDKEKISVSNYDYVDSISAFCKLKNIKLLFFQSPLRKGIYSSLNEKKSSELHTHVDRIAEILKRDNHVLIDADKIVWDDALFIDGEHFSAKGAKAFTTYCFNQLDSLHLRPIVSNHSLPR
jgi:hypothetical protein